MPMVKRVVGIGGDRIACCTDGKLTVNGEKVEEPYLPADTNASLTDQVHDRQAPLPPGDERSGSLATQRPPRRLANGSVERGAVQARATQ